MSEEYKSRLTLRLDWSDLDLFGHVNNVAFFRYMQAGRVSFCEAVGLSSIDPELTSFMVASSCCQFKKALRFPGTVSVTTQVAWIKNTSFQLCHTLHDQHEQICAEGEDVIVVYDHVRACKMTIGQPLRERLEAALRQ